MYKTQHYAFCCDLTGVQVVRCVHKPNPLNPGGKGTDTDEIIWSGKIVVRDINSKTPITITDKFNKQILLNEIFYFDRDLVGIIKQGDIILLNSSKFGMNANFDSSIKDIERHYIHKLNRPSNRTRIGRLEAYSSSSN